MKKGNTSLYLQYLVIVGVVAVIGTVIMLLYQGGDLSGAPIYEEIVDQYDNLCSDDDEANNYFVVGSAKLGRIRYHDHCRGDKLYQYECPISTVVRQTRPYTCPNGCINGACLK